MKTFGKTLLWYAGAILLVVLLNYILDFYGRKLYGGQRLTFPYTVAAIIGLCSCYAVLTLRKSWRAWTGYLAAALALTPILASATAHFYFWRFDKILNDGRKEVNEIPPEQFEEFLRSSPYRNSEPVLSMLFRRPEFTAEMLHRIVMQTPLSELQKEHDFHPHAMRFYHRPLFSTGLYKENLIIPVKMSLVVRHPNVDVQTLVYLAEISNPFVQYFVASSPKTPVETLQKLSQEKHEWIDRVLAENPNTPTDMLHDLAGSSEEIIRRGVAENPNASKETLHKLAQDSNNWVRVYVARNSNIGKEDLEHFRVNRAQQPRRGVT